VRSSSTVAATCVGLGSHVAHDWTGRGAWRSREQPLALSCRAELIDTRLVRAELARLRGPRPATESPSARAIRSTVAGCS
jgi:hypothetical protein